MTRELQAELDGLPDTDVVLEARALMAFLLALTQMDARAFDEARIELDRLPAFGDALHDPEWRAVAEWKHGLVDMLVGDIDGGIARVGAVAHAAVGQGWESTGVTAFKEASTASAAALDYPAAVRWIDEGVRYAEFDRDNRIVPM